MKVSREIKKEEAIKRLKEMEIVSEAIRQFEEDDLVNVSENPYGALYWADDAQKKLIEEFEEEYDGLVYLANLCNTEFGKLLSLFYVSDYKEEWEMENEDIKDGYSCVYCINLDCPDFSEFGSIAFQPIFGGVKRIG